MSEIIKDGYRINDETGEVLGLVCLAPTFTVDSLSAAEWVLERFAEVEGEERGLLARRDALVSNLDYQIEAVRRRRDWLAVRFTPELETYAKGALAGMNQRFVPTAFGRLAFRKSGGSIRVTNPEAALAYLEAYCPEAIKVSRSVLVTPLKGREEELPAEAFEVLAPSDTFRIETGVK